MNRRALVGGAALVTAGALNIREERRSRVPRRAPPRSHVAILRCDRYEQTAQLVQDGLKLLAPTIRNKRVLLKPNLVEYSPAAPINTNPVLIASVIEALYRMGAASVTVADGPGHVRDTDLLLFESGLQEQLDLVIRLELVRWETHASPAAGRPQGVINNQIGEYDIFVGIMWRRFGTPTGEAGSGTEEEFNRAYHSFSERGVPHIMFYFCQAPAPPPKSEREVNQLMRLVAFRDRLSSLALVWEYADHQDFAATVRPHLLSGLTRVLAQRDHARELTSADHRNLSGLRDQLIQLANKYSRERQELPAGDQRTRRLELIATEIRTAAFEGAPLLPGFMKGADPGERLVAVIFLQVTPLPAHLMWLGERLSERQPFLGYHSAVALLAAARSLDCSHSREVRSAVALGMQRLGSKHGTDRYRTLLAAQQVLTTRCGDSLEN